MWLRSFAAQTYRRDVGSDRACDLPSVARSLEVDNVCISLMVPSGERLGSDGPSCSLVPSLFASLPHAGWAACTLHRPAVRAVDIARPTQPVCWLAPQALAGSLVAHVGAAYSLLAPAASGRPLGSWDAPRTEVIVGPRGWTFFQDVQTAVATEAPRRHTPLTWGGAAVDGAAQAARVEPPVRLVRGEEGSRPKPFPGGRRDGMPQSID